MTSSRKPEIHNVSQSRQRRTELRPQSTHKENLVKFGRVVLEIMPTDRQTDRQTNRQRRHSKNEPQPWTLTCTKIWWSSAVRFSSYVSGQRQTDRQTDILIATADQWTYTRPLNWMIINHIITTTIIYHRQDKCTNVNHSTKQHNRQQ